MNPYSDYPLQLLLLKNAFHMAIKLAIVKNFALVLILRLHFVLIFATHQWQLTGYGYSAASPNSFHFSPRKYLTSQVYA